MSERERSAGIDKPELPPIPSGLSDVLERASADPAFRRALLAEREAALSAAGIELSARERAILRTVPVTQLESMISRFTVLGSERRKFLSQAAAAVTVLGGATLSAFQMGCKKKPTRAESQDMKEGGGHTPHMADSERPGAPPPKLPPPKCPMTLQLGEFRTVSGPDRSPGKVDRDRLQEQLERICESVSVKTAGKVTYEFDVAAGGAVTNIKAVNNTIAASDFDVLARRQLERLVLFGAGEASRVTVDIELR